MIGAEIEGSLDCLQSMHPSPSTRQNSSCENEANCVSEIATVKVRAEVSGQRANDESSSPQTSVSSTTLVSSPTTSSGPPTIVSPNSTTTCDSRIPRFSGTLSSTGLATTSTNWGLRRSSSLRMRTEESPIHQSPVSTVSSSLSVRQHYQHRRLHHHTQHSQQHYQHSEQRTLPVITDNGTDSPRQRSLSLSLTPVRPRKIHAATGGSSTALADDSDAESVKSYGSACSTASACDHAAIALNGTTWSGRSRKYVVHCSNHTTDNEQYLTPTQRAARQVRKFQALLKEARKEIEEKDREILRLTKEVVELRLYKASLNSPDERTDSSDCLTVRENNPFSPESPSKDLPDETDLQKSSGDIEDGTVTVTTPDTPEKRLHADLPSSLADSGHFEDGSVHSKDSILLSETNNEATKIIECSNRQLAADSSGNSYATLSVDSPNRDAERRALVDLYENRIENMHRRHVDELQELKEKHNDKVESLLNQLAEVSTRYCELRPSLDAAEARARELESELEAMKQEMEEQKTLFNDQEERHKQMYLKMYAKGQEAARIEQADKILECAHQNPPKVTVAELLQQLTVTQAELENIKDTSYSPEPHISTDRSQSLLSAQEAVSLWVLGTRKAMYRRIVEAKSQHGALDPEITLQFLKSAIYYFLTDKENHQGHLNAIESILGFTEAEKHNIDKIHRPLRK